MKTLLVMSLLCLSGCSLFTRTEQKQVDTHRDEKTVVTKTTHVKGVQAGQPTDVVTTETTTSKTTRDDSSTSTSQTDTSSAALDHAASALETAASALANAYVPGSGGLVSSAVHALGLNGDAAAGLATVGASLAGWQLHKRGKKKGHEEAKKGIPPV